MKGSNSARISTAADHFLTPELALGCPVPLGSDIMMVLDECPGHDDPPEKVIAAMERTHRWAERSRSAYRDNSQALIRYCAGRTKSRIKSEIGAVSNLAYNLQATRLAA